MKNQQNTSNYRNDIRHADHGECTRKTYNRFKQHVEIADKSISA